MRKNNAARVMTLSNGIRVVVEKRPTNKAAFIFLVDCGARNDPKNIVGVSHATEHMMFEGTPSLTARDISMLFESFGAAFNAETGPETTNFYFESCVRDFEQAAEIYGDALNNSLFDEKIWRKECRTILEEKIDTESGDTFVWNFLNEQAFGLREGIIGSIRTIRRITPNDMREMVRRNYRPENIVISIAGGVEYDKAFAVADRIFGNFHKSWGMNAGMAPYPYFPRMVHSRYVEKIDKYTTHTSMAIAFPGYTIHDNERYAQRVMSLIFGGGFSSRLYMKLRDERGLVYMIDSATSAEKEDGLLRIITMSTKPKEALRAIFDELYNIVSRGITEEELKIAQRRVTATLAMDEDSYRIAEENACNILDHGLIISDSKHASAIESLTVDDINSAAREILVPSKAVMAVMGHKPLFKEASKILVL